MSGALEVAGLCCGYGGIPVVRDLALEVHAGELVVLLGRNGAGKTTSLLTISGVLPALAGEVRFEGTVTRAPLHERIQAGMGLITDDRSVFFSLTVRENLRLGRGPVSKALEFFPELEDFMSKRAGLLSGGQQQMLSLARVLAADPRILLGDEISLGLAPIIVKRLLAALRKAADDGAAILVVEQHAELALGVADRGYVLDGGEIVLAGTAQELIDKRSQIEGAYLAVPIGSDSDPRGAS